MKTLSRTSTISALLLICASLPGATCYGNPALQDWNQGTTESVQGLGSGENGWDLRSRNIGSLDLRLHQDSLLKSDFDDFTVWPETNLPQAFSYREIRERGRDPGLKIRKLHSLGLTGKGALIAFIDQPLLVEHEEYRNRLRGYGEVGLPERGVQASMHGPAVVSIAIGKSCGVAPGAEFMYRSAFSFDPSGDRGKTMKFKAEAIQDLIRAARSQGFPIKVLSLSIGWELETPGGREMEEAVERARGLGMFVVSSSMGRHYGFKAQVLGRDPLEDPNLIKAYHPPGFAWRHFRRSPRDVPDRLLIPGGSRTLADPHGQFSYQYQRKAAWSWMVPWISGLYALAYQMNENVSPEEFWKIALETGLEYEVEVEGRKFIYGKIIQPIQLISEMAKRKK